MNEPQRIRTRHHEPLPMPHLDNVLLNPVDVRVLHRHLLQHIAELLESFPERPWRTSR